MRKSTHKERTAPIVPNTIGLTRMQEAFCQIYCTRDDLNQTQCAIEAGYAESSAGQVASKFLNGRDHPDIVKRIEEIQAELAKKYEVTFENHVRKLAEIRDAAFRDKQYPAAIAAEKSRGQAAGLYIDRKQIMMGRIDQMSKDEVLAEIERLQKDYPALRPADTTFGGRLIEGTCEELNVEETRAAVMGSLESPDEASGGMDQD